MGVVFGYSVKIGSKNTFNVRKKRGSQKIVPQRNLFEIFIKLPLCTFFNIMCFSDEINKLTSFLDPPL